jgi:hypothetical protein
MELVYRRTSSVYCCGETEGTQAWHLSGGGRDLRVCCEFNKGCIVLLGQSGPREEAGYVLLLHNAFLLWIGSEVFGSIVCKEMWNGLISTQTG